MILSKAGNSREHFSRFIFCLALGLWGLSTLLRFWNVDLYAGITFDDTAYAVSGKNLLEKGRGYWGDTLRPFATWWVAFFHKINGVSVVNVAVAFAALRSLGELFLILAARRLFRDLPWAPLMVAAVAGSSFLGVHYGKQHLSSLLCTIPFSLWLYCRYLASEKWRDWLLCSVGSGLVFLSHYNTIAVLAIMLGLEMLRLKWLGRKLSQILSIGLSGIAICFVTVMVLGKQSYGYKNWVSYLKLVWLQMAQNQTQVSPVFSDGFLFSFVSWEGAMLLLYLGGMGWLIRRTFWDVQERRFLAFGFLPFLGAGLVWLRVNLGYLSFPRLYVFAFAFVWLAAAGLLSVIVDKSMKDRPHRLQKSLAIVIALFFLSLMAAHHSTMKRFPSANAALERYLQNRPTAKMAVWSGNPHLAAFLFGWRWCPPSMSKEEAENQPADIWRGMDGPKMGPPLADAPVDPRCAIYLQHPSLAEVCDTIIFQTPNTDMLNRYDVIIRKAAPHVVVTNFYNGTSSRLPIAADDGGVLSSAPNFSSQTPLPIVRLYDLHGTGK